MAVDESFAPTDNAGEFEEHPMSTCPVKRVTAVEPHPLPEGSHLNVVRLDDAQLVSMKVNGQPRYKVGDLVVHIVPGSLLPVDLLKRLDAWNEAEGKGKLEGKALGNRIKASNFKTVRSEGMLLPVAEVPGEPLAEGDDAAPALGISFA